MIGTLRAALRLLGLVALQLVLCPVRVLLGMFGCIAVFAGAVGTVVWSIQLVVWLLGGDGGGGPLSAPLMVLACAAALPAGMQLLILAERTGHHQHEAPEAGEPAYNDDDVEVVYPDEIYEPWESTPFNPAGTIRIVFDHDTWYADRAA